MSRMGKQPRPIIDRIMDKLDVRGQDECWEWTGYVSTASRYPYIGVGPRRPKQVRRAVHRLVYEHHHGTIPSGKVVRHTCDNTICGNPAHLVIGTQADNVRDRVERGRQSKAGAKLTVEQVAEIRERATTEKQRALANAFGVSEAQISRIVNHINWRTEE